MPGNIRLWGTSGYVELAAPAGAANQVLTLPTDSIQPAMVLISSQSFSAVSSVSINNCFSSLYQNYKVVVNYTSSSVPTINYRLRSGGVDNSTSNYHIQRHQASGASVFSALSSSQTSWGGWSINANFPTHQVVELFNPFSNNYTLGWYSFTRMNSATTTDVEQGSNLFSSTTSFDGITFLGTANISGSIMVYGYRNS